MRAGSVREELPRRVRRARLARARVSLREEPRATSASDGAVTSRQEADVDLPREELERIWTPEYLERLAATYWRFLRRVSLGLLRVVYSPDAREIVLLGRPLVLLRFHAPEYETSAERGAVTWRIEQGLLVMPRGRGKGFLRISVERQLPAPSPSARLETVTVRSEVANFYPMIAGSGRFSRLGRIIYRATQLRLHVIITSAFLRSLARLDLVPSTVGALRPPPDAGESEPPAQEPEPSGAPSGNGL